MPAATFVGSFENLGCARWSIDFMLPPNFCHEPRRFLLPSVFGATGLASVQVDADLANGGIILVFRLLTLADRAKEALVGVVIARGSPPSERSFVGVI